VVAVVIPGTAEYTFASGFHLALLTVGGDLPRFCELLGGSAEFVQSGGAGAN
jgi:hypothetical protein